MTTFPGASASFPEPAIVDLAGCHPVPAVDKRRNCEHFWGGNVIIGELNLNNRDKSMNCLCFYNSGGPECRCGLGIN